ncbi:MAG: hypothetical protein HRS50_02205 [Mycoplasmataceae bacterium]|nr:hypothetical protein [Mycoplasmataceae bacterium]
MVKNLLEKINDVIDKHINEVIDRKLKSEKQSLREFIKNEIDSFSKESKKLYKDVFGVQCIISNMNQDHVMPKKENGVDSGLNLLWMCKESNETKGSQLEGEVSSVKFKITKDKKHILKSGEIVGKLQIYDKNKELWQTIGSKKENNRFIKFKKEMEKLKK